MTFVNITKREGNFFYYARDIIALVIIMESADDVAYVRREGNASFKSPALDIIQRGEGITSLILFSSGIH